MNTITRRDQSRNLTLQDEVNRLFEDNFLSRTLESCRPSNLGASGRYLRNRK